MGCVQTRPSVYSPSEGLVKLKLQNGYAKRGYGGRPIRHKPPEKLDGKSAGTLVDGGGGGGGGEEMVGREDENKLNGGGGNVSQKITVKRIGGDELVDGWPKWLVDNIHRDALVGLVPKSVDSYEKLAKVCLFRLSISGDSRPNLKILQIIYLLFPDGSVEIVDRNT